MVDWRKLLGNMGGIATGKVVKYLGKFIPFDYTVAGVSLKNIGLGIAMTAGAEYFAEEGIVKDLLELGGAAIVIDEIAHAAGINSPAPQRVVTKAAPKAVSVSAKPKKSVIVV